MTRAEVNEIIYQIIEEAVGRCGASYTDVDRIWAAIGRLSPEAKPKPEVPWYDPKKVKRVGTLVQRSQFTPEQKQAAVEALRAVGLL
jgi:hypothetical protein